VKKALKILVPVVILSALVVGGYFYYKSSVAYAAVSIYSAVESRDWDKFKEFVDVNETYESLMASLVGENEFAKNISNAMKESAVDGLKKAVIERPDGGDSGKVSVKDAIGLLKMAKTYKKGDSVVVDIPLETKDIDFNVPDVELPNVKMTISLIFKKGGGHLVLKGIGVDLDNEDLMELLGKLLGGSLQNIF
jgi:hypothetical protein